MTTTFETVKIGDRVWSLRHGWGVVRDVVWNGLFPVQVTFPNNRDGSYTLDGLSYFGDINPSIFWDEVKFEVPQKPMPDLEVDTKVMVWSDGGKKINRHFSHFDKDGVLHVFYNGKTSFTNDGDTSPWDNWELAE